MANNSHVTSKVDNVPPLDRRAMLAALRSFRRGDFAARLPGELTGVDGQICEAFNDVVQMASALAEEVVELRTAVGRNGRASKRLRRGAGKGGWEVIYTSINEVVDDVTTHASDMARVCEAVTRGDLSARIDIDGRAEPLKGQFLAQAETVNRMATTLASYTDELGRLAHEVGVDGKLGAQARPHGAAGAWRELSDGVNVMAANLTAQLREVARVTTAVAQGDLSKVI